MIVRGLRDILLWLCAPTLRLECYFLHIPGQYSLGEIVILIRDICD